MNAFCPDPANTLGSAKSTEPKIRNPDETDYEFYDRLPELLTDEEITEVLAARGIEKRVQ